MTLRKRYHTFFTILFILILILNAISCNQSNTKNDQEDDIPLLQKIQESGVLKVAIDFNSINYFVYRGKPMGYQYELIHALCKDLQVKPEITVNNNLGETIEGLQNGQFDLIAKNLTDIRELRRSVDFTKPLKQTRQVLVQRKPKSRGTDSTYVKTVSDLAERKVHVQHNSTNYHRIKYLSAEMTEAVEIAEDSVNGAEQLIALVASGEIDYTVCDENLAMINQLYYPNIDISLKVSFPQNIAWAVRKGSGEWKKYLDEWIIQFKQTKEYRDIYYRYFVNPRLASRFNSDYHSTSGGGISIYDPLVKELASKHGWDWRLISAIMYHESRFDPEAESWGGAYGLMQLMPATAESLGVADITDPRQNIEGGILLLNWLNDQLKPSLPDSVERVKFVLASYNIGLGHVKDAQRLAKKYGKNSQVWDNQVDYYMKNKSADRYISDPAVKWGYARGEEAYNFVNRVIANYEHYRNLIPE
jgi:membrane-bound lytic murein transglycosylase F